MTGVAPWSALLLPLALVGCSMDGSTQPAHGWFEQSVPEGSPGYGDHVWVASDHDVWLGSSSIWHFDGVKWVETPPPRPMIVRGFIGFGRFDVWAVGALQQGAEPAGIAIHWNGAAWSEVTPSNGAQLGDVLAIAGTSSSDLWLGDGYSSTLFHYDGMHWTAFPEMRAGAPMWAANPSDAWLSGCWHFDGTAWVQYQGQPCPDAISALWGFAPDDVWSTPSNGAPIHWDGSSWTDDGPYDPAYGGYAALWGSGPSDVYVGGIRGRFAHYDGSTWTEGPDISDEFSFVEIHGSSANNIWAVVGEGGPSGYVVMRYSP